MKISKRQLKRIIKEEKAKLLKENRQEVWALLDQIQGMGIPADQLLEYILGNWMPGHDAAQALSDYLSDEMGQ